MADEGLCNSEPLSQSKVPHPPFGYPLPSREREVEMPLAIWFQEREAEIGASR